MKPPSLDLLEGRREENPGALVLHPEHSKATLDLKEAGHWFDLDSGQMQYQHVEYKRQAPETQIRYGDSVLMSYVGPDIPSINDDSTLQGLATEPRQYEPKRSKISLSECRAPVPTIDVHADADSVLIDFGTMSRKSPPPFVTRKPDRGR
jgi:hypothetical protein